MRHVFLWSCVWALVMMSGCVTPEQYQTLENRVVFLEMGNNRQLVLQSEFKEKEADLVSMLEVLEKKVVSNEGTTREAIAEIKYELKRVQIIFGQLQGLIEEMEYRIGSSDPGGSEDLEKALDRLDSAISRNYTRIINLEKYMGFEPTMADQGDAGLAAQGQPEDDAGQTEPLSEKALYDAAKKLFDDGALEAVRVQFENFINLFPESPYAGNARFWIADSYYVEKWYEKAILEYQRVLEQYPDSNKTAAARLKQGYAFAELGEKANARLILNELVTRHPDSREAGFARGKLKHLD